MYIENVKNLDRFTILQEQTMKELLSIESEFELKEKLLELLTRADELGVKDEFAARYQKLTEATQKKSKRKLKKASSLMEKELEEPIVYVGVGEEVPLLVEGTCILSAKPKLGKSWLVLAMCLAISRGEDFLGYKTKRSSTLYLDLETSEQLQQKRIRKALNGTEIPDNFYIDTETDSLDNGFCEQIESYIAQDPAIGVVIIDVFQIIRSSSKNSKENEYEHAYRDITPLNELAKKYHISIILVCHDRKMVDMDDPFANILGSTGLQGAVAQMMVMFKPRKDLPIHLAVKGKTIDGLVDLNIALDSGSWSLIDGSVGTSFADYNYLHSEIRKAVIAIAKDGEWTGTCKDLKDDARKKAIFIKEGEKGIGNFLNSNIDSFGEEGIEIHKIKNGNAGYIYRILHSPLMTIDEEYTQTSLNPYK